MTCGGSIFESAEGAARDDDLRSAGSAAAASNHANDATGIGRGCDHRRGRRSGQLGQCVVGGAGRDRIRHLHGKRSCAQSRIRQWAAISRGAMRVSGVYKARYNGVADSGRTRQYRIARAGRAETRRRKRASRHEQLP